MDELKKEILKHRGTYVNTIYGSSLVVGIVEEDGQEYIHLKEHGEEDYYIKLTQDSWETLLQ